MHNISDRHRHGASQRNSAHGAGVIGRTNQIHHDVRRQQRTGVPSEKWGQRQREINAAENCKPDINCACGPRSQHAISATIESTTSVQINTNCNQSTVPAAIAAQKMATKAIAAISPNSENRKWPMREVYQHRTALQNDCYGNGNAPAHGTAPALSALSVADAAGAGDGRGRGIVGALDCNALDASRATSKSNSKRACTICGYVN